MIQLFKGLQIFFIAFAASTIPETPIACHLLGDEILANNARLSADTVPSTNIWLFQSFFVCLRF